MQELTWIGIGGLVGSLARYGLMIAYSHFFENTFYVGTLIINLIGCLLIGFFFGVLKESSPYILLLITGFCGGFTTFSTFALEGMRLLREQMISDFIIYSFLSFVGGLLLCFLGYHFAEKL